MNAQSGWIEGLGSASRGMGWAGWRQLARTTLALWLWLGMSAVAHAGVAMQPPTLAIGNVRVATTLSKSGSAVLSADTATAVTLQLGTTSDCSQFQITSATSLTLGPSPVTVTVMLTPGSIGPKTCRLHVVQGTTTLASFDVTGAATAPELSHPLQLNLGAVELGRSASGTLTLSNIGTEPLEIGTLSTDPWNSNTPSWVFWVDQPRGTTIQPGQSFSWTVGCNPVFQGSDFADIVIPSNSFTFIGGPNTTTDSTFVKCTGQEARLGGTPTSLDFGTVLRGDSRLLAVTLTNTGNLPLTQLTSTLTGTGTGFQIDASTLPTSLAAGASATVSVLFTPPRASDGGTATLTFSSPWGSFGSIRSWSTTLRGAATATGITVAPGTLDFGVFRFDEERQQVFHITNAGDTTVTIQSATLTPDAGTAASELAAVIRLAGATVTLPRQLDAGQQLEVTVTARPNNRAGLVSGHLDVHGSFAGAVDQRVALTGTATSAAFDAPAQLDFGAVDVTGPAASQTLAIRNTGQASLSIASIVRVAGASPAFSVTLPTDAVSLSPGEALSLPVTYAPTTATTDGNLDTLTLVVQLSGIAGGPGQLMIPIHGHGIDRHLVVDATVSFPPTHPYPGSLAPNQAVTVHNTGAAALQISAEIVAGAPVWQLIDPASFEIPGGGSRDLRLRFSPTAIGPTSGQLTLSSNDRANPTTTIALSGSGVVRRVEFAAATLDLGDASIGEVVSRSVTVRNRDPDHAVVVRDISLGDSPVFSLGAAAGTRIEAGQSVSLRIQFAPTATGDAHATASLYLDDDPAIQASTELIGHGGPHSAGPPGGDSPGGGGCATHGGGGAALGVLALGMLRRRRRSEAP